VEDTTIKCTDCGEEEADGWTYDADLGDDVYWSITVGPDGLCGDCFNEKEDRRRIAAEHAVLAGDL
jgi:hypothetical protein